MDPSVSLEDLERVSENRAHEGHSLVSYGVILENYYAVTFARSIFTLPCHAIFSNDTNIFIMPDNVLYKSKSGHKNLLYHGPVFFNFIRVVWL